MAAYYCLPAPSSPRTTTNTRTTVSLAKTKTPIVGIYAIIGLVLVLIQTALVVQVDAFAFARPHQQRACAAAPRTTTSLNFQDTIVAYQGEPGAYSEKATRELLGNNVIALGKPNFEACFRAVASMEVDYCCLPIENSLGGISIHEFNGLMLQYDLKICAEHEFRVQHCVLAKKDVVLPGCRSVDANGKTTVAKYAISHPQALAECDNYLRGYGITPIPTYDTMAKSAKMIRDDDLPNRCTPENTIAIASDLAGTAYDLICLAEGVGDDDSNVTRFLLLGCKASNKLQTDKEVALAAVKRDGLALKNASTKMKADKDVVLAAVKQNGLALKNASNGMNTDKQVVLEAVKQNGLALEKASNAMQTDKQVVLAAVKQDGMALEFASNEMKTDKEVVLAAVKQTDDTRKSNSVKLSADRKAALALVEPGNTNALAVRLEQEVVRKSIQHQLACEYFSRQQFWFFWVPPVLAFSATVALAVAAIPKSFDERLQVILAVAGILQTVKEVRDYGTRAEAHKSTFQLLEFLREELKLGQKAASKEDRFESIEFRILRCYAVCKSTIPSELSEAFEDLDAELVFELAKKNQLRSESSIYFQACDILKEEISNSLFFPMFMFDSKKVVIATMKRVRENVAQIKTLE